MLTVACALALPSPVAAHIYECRGPGGSRQYTNSPRARQRCRLVVRSQGGRRARLRPPVRGPKVPIAVSADRQARLRRWQAYIEEAAALYHLPVPFITAVMRVESGFNPNVVSHAGAMGLMQLMPQTAQAMGVRDPFDPRQNVLGGARYLRLLANRFGGDITLTVAAYNAGHGAVERYHGIPPYAETQRYVRRVLQHYAYFRGAR
ncbi:MAG: lytic transglycosylase domain-containing protein [Polyangiales bacterium]